MEPVQPQSPPHDLAVGDGSPAGPDAERALPPSYYALLKELPTDYEGEDRIRWLVERVDHIPRADRDAVRLRYDGLARQMVALDASDMDFGGPAANERVWYRVDGAKRANEETGAYTLDESDLLILSLLSPAQHQRLLERFALDFGYSVPSDDDEPNRRFRTTVYYDNKHLALCKRLLAWKPRPLRSLGFHPVIERGFMFRHVRDGLTLFTGVTGSGKSTTLDAIIDANNDDFEGHILIVAQPIEYIHTSKRCIIRHREVGTDVRVVRRRHDSGAPAGPRHRHRRRDARPRDDLDGDGDGRHRPQGVLDAPHRQRHRVHRPHHRRVPVGGAGARALPPRRRAPLHRLAEAAPAVGGGRVLAKEVLWVTSSVRAAIKNGNTNEIYQMIWQGSDQGMITLEQDLARLVQIGDITTETAINYANNKRRLISLLR